MRPLDQPCGFDSPQTRSFSGDRNAFPRFNVHVCRAGIPATMAELGLGCLPLTPTRSHEWPTYLEWPPNCTMEQHHRRLSARTGRRGRESGYFEMRDEQTLAESWAREALETLKKETLKKETLKKETLTKETLTKETLRCSCYPDRPHCPQGMLTVTGLARPD